MSPSGRVVGEERSALLSGDEEASAREASDQPHTPLSEAVQELQVTLGRFHRSVIRGREGAPPDSWTADCMDELIAAVEQARAHQWPEVLKALVDTARVLQSYEDAELPEDALPFLEDSHDLLAMIVVDLGTGSLRPGVVDRWREHYHSALQDLEEQGVEVVADEDPNPAPASAETRGRAVDDKEAAPFSLAVDLSPVRFSHDDDMPALDELPPLGQLGTHDEPAAFTPSAPQAAAEPFDEDDDLPPLESFGEASYMHVEEEAAEEPAPPVTPVRGGPPRVIVDMLDTLCTELNALERKTPGARDPEALFDYLSQLREYAGAINAQPAESLCQGLIVLCQMLSEDADAWGNDRFFEIAYSFCGAYGEACTLGETATVASWRDEAESFVEALTAPPTHEETAQPEEQTAVFFEDLQPESDDEIEPSLEDYIAAQAAAVDSESVCAEQEAEAVVDTPPLDEEAPFDLMPEDASETEQTSALPDFADVFAATAAKGSGAYAMGELLESSPSDASSVDLLLETARQALLNGDAGDAKLLALRAVAQIAAVEAARAEALVHETERRLRQSTEAIDAARNDVQHVEQEVGRAEQEVASGHETVHARHSDVELCKAGLEETELRIAQIDDEIRRLEERRQAELERREAQEREWDAGRQAAADAETHLGALQTAEEAARVRLEDARQAVKHLQLRRAELETAVTRARDALVAQRNSLVDLERTIALVKGEVPSQAEDEDQLF
jgi:predicted  nucleic acid-binding Zn-ribbon protein